MTEVAHVSYFKAGDKVPDWILSAEPRNAGSHFDPFRFTVDVKVIDADDMILLVPLGSGDSIITLGESSNVEVFSEAKTTRLVTSQTIFSPRYPIPRGVTSTKTEDRPSAWWRRFWPFGPQQ